METNNYQYVATGMGEYRLYVTLSDHAQVFDAITTSDDLESTIEKLIWETKSAKDTFTICLYNKTQMMYTEVVCVSTVKVTIKDVIPVIATEPECANHMNTMMDFNQYRSKTE
jgi:uncharacterized protein (UPF0262 family)